MTNATKDFVRVLALLALCFFAVYWVSVIYHVVRGYLSGGMAGVEAWFAHTSPRQTVLPGGLDTGWAYNVPIVLRLGLALLATVLLVVVSLPLLKEMRESWGKSARK